MKDLSVVIPTFNEEKIIIPTIYAVDNYLKTRNLKGEIIVSDDASSDKTVKEVEKLKNKYGNLSILEMDRNYYKGWPVKQGMLRAQGKLILYMDADMSTPIEEADKLIKAIENGADLAIGSRIHNGKDLRESQPLYRRILGKVFSNFKSILIPKIDDSQCGFKMFTHESAKKLFSKQKIENIIFDVEILYLADKFGLKISQVPVEWKHSGETRMKVTAKNAIDTISSLFKIWLWHH